MALHPAAVLRFHIYLLLSLKYRHLKRLHHNRGAQTPPQGTPGEPGGRGALHGASDVTVEISSTFRAQRGKG